VRPERERLARIVDELIARHRSSGGENLIALLLASQEGDPAAVSDQVRDDALTILLAGHDTIANALVWTWVLLAGHPAAQAGLEREVDAVLGRRPARSADAPALRKWAPLRRHGKAGSTG
jgi:pentalenene oxygenase